jgi:hypothetical protein
LLANLHLTSGPNQFKTAILVSFRIQYINQSGFCFNHPETNFTAYALVKTTFSFSDPYALMTGISSTPDRCMISINGITWISTDEGIFFIRSKGTEAVDNMVTRRSDMLFFFN